ncbi:MAG TPA: ParM/StbA family protein [Trichocoleus sp.]
MQLLRQSKAAGRHHLATICHALPTGLDIGNGAAKLVLPYQEVRIPSYIQPVHGNLFDAPATGGLVSYLEGNATALVGHSWLSGKAAYQRNPEGYLRVVDDRHGKLSHGLPLLLGALSTLPHRPVWELAVMASIHHQKAMGDELVERLSGCHTVRFNGAAEPSCVRVEVLKTLDEGAGAIAHCVEADLTNQTLVYDFGSGTTVVSVFGAKGKLVDRQVSPGGVQALIDAVAKNTTVIRRLAQEGDRQIIREGIERGDFLYGIQGVWSFEEVYQAELKPWISTVLKGALKVGAKWTPTSSAVIAIGGGSQLPLVQELLRQQGILPVRDGVWANARGLQRLAAMVLGGNR